MIRKFISKLFNILLSCILLTSCETDLDIIHESENFPIVYCLLNPDDSVHYVRIQKTFTGAENALLMAKISDSIYYQNAIVKLDTWENNYKIQTIILEPSYEIIKEKGVFSSNNHLIYKTSETILGNAVSLSIEIPDYNKTVYSSVNIINTPYFTRPRTYSNQISLYNSQAFEINFTGGGPFNELGIRVYYSEIKNNIEEEKMVEIMKRNTFYTSTPGFIYYLREENLFRPLSMAIGKDSTVNYRRFRKIELAGYSACEEFLQFQELYQSTNDLNHLPYSNIINGHGLLASRAAIFWDGFEFTRRSMDSLRNGRFTNHLKFVN